MTRCTLVAPVTADPSLSGMRASTFSAGAIAGEIGRRGTALRLHCGNPDTGDQAGACMNREARLAVLPFRVSSRSALAAKAVQPAH